MRPFDSSRQLPFMADPTLEPALAVIREHRDVAQGEVERLKDEIEQRREQQKRLDEQQKAAAQKLQDFTTELRAHERVLERLRVPSLH